MFRRKFDDLCNALQRSDPTVTRVKSNCINQFVADNHTWLQTLADALQNNTVVSEIDICLDHFVSVAERQQEVARDKADIATSARALLMQWMERSTSLVTVKISRKSSPRESESSNQLQTLLLQEIIQAISKNSLIQALELKTTTSRHGSLQLWTDYFNSQPKKLLQSLMIEVNDRDIENADIQSAAQAIGALPQLKTLAITVNSERLEHVLTTLQSHPTLIDLTIEGYEHDEAPAPTVLTLLSDVLKTCTNLTSVGLYWQSMDADFWELVALALQSNHSIHTLRLRNIHFSEESTALFMHDFQDSDTDNAKLQHIRTLELHGVSFLKSALDGDGYDSCTADIANGLFDSPLQHLTVDWTTLVWTEMPDFFELLAANASKVRLRSLTLRTYELSDDVRHPLELVAEYLSRTVHLHDLTVKIETALQEGDCPPLSVPPFFLSSLRCNASLRTVQLLWLGQEEDSEREYQSVIQDNDLRYIDAVTTRNRMLPELLAQSKLPRDDDREMTDTTGILTDTPASSLLLVPTLYDVALPAEQMSPSTFLMGLMGASESFRHSNAARGSGRSDGKRVAPDP